MAKKLKIPFYRQKNAFTCGPASLQMLFAFFRKAVPQAKIAERTAATESYGTRHQNMIDEALKEKFFCYVNNNSTINEVKYFIDTGLPVIIDYVEPSEEEGHYAVVFGYSARYIFLNDPWNGKNFRLPIGEFNSRWYDYHQSHKFKKWIMVVSDKEFRLGKQYRP